MTRWQLARHAPTAGRHSTSARHRQERRSPTQPVLVEYDSDGQRGAHHPEPATRRQRDHHGDGGAADGDPGDDRGPSRRPRRDHHRRRRPGLLGRQRPAPAQGHDQGGLAAAAPGLRPHALHPAPAAQADLRRRQRDRLRRRLRDRPEHRLHHRVRQRHLRPARSDDRPGRRRRLAGAASPPAPAGQGPADADDRRPDHRAGGLPAGHGQRALPPGRADGGGAPDRGQDRQQLTNGGAGSQAGRPDGPGAADRAGHRDHDGGPLALGRPPRPRSKASAPSTTTGIPPSRIPTTDARSRAHRGGPRGGWRP